MRTPFEGSERSVEKLEVALSTLSLLQSLYCLEDEFIPTDETSTLLEAFADGEDPATLLSVTSLRFLQAVLHVPLEDDGHGTTEGGVGSKHSVGLQLRLSLSAAAAAAMDDSTSHLLSIRLEPPDWLSRKQFESLSESFQSELVKEMQNADAEDSDPVWDVAKAVDIVKSKAVSILGDILRESAVVPVVSSVSTAQTLVRVWMHLPSLSTKSKRDDLVSYAPKYSITGIVHAGKPALIILEAPTANDIEAYLSDIKTYSWADIPSSHKKISEKLREEGLKPEDRIFSDMQEITDEININGMKGVRGNRGDLGALRDWLVEKGLSGDNLSIVLGTNLHSQ